MDNLTTENYLKAIYLLSQDLTFPVGSNHIAGRLGVKPASITNMCIKLERQGFIEYKKHEGVTLTHKGHKLAVKVIRKHRIWETFLQKILHFSWSEVHEIAEQLEHVDSDLLVDRLERFLGNPKTDPHGDLIPNQHGDVEQDKSVLLSALNERDEGKLVRVNQENREFLDYLEKNKLLLGVTLEVMEKSTFDSSLRVRVDHADEVFISREASFGMHVQKIEK